MPTRKDSSYQPMKDEPVKAKEETKPTQVKEPDNAALDREPGKQGDTPVPEPTEVINEANQPATQGEHVVVHETVQTPDGRVIEQDRVTLQSGESLPIQRIHEDFPRDGSHDEKLLFIKRQVANGLTDQLTLLEYLEELG